MMQSLFLKWAVALPVAFATVAASAVPGAFETWFENAVPGYGTADAWTTISPEATLADNVLTIDDWEDGVTYTPETTETAYQRETISLSAEPLPWEDLEAVDMSAFEDAKFAVCLALSEEGDTPVFAAYTAGGWVEVESPAPIAGNDHTLVITYDTSANTFTITEGSTTSEPLSARGTGSALAATRIVGSGSVSVLSGDVAGEAAASYNGVGYNSVSAAIAAAEADEYAHGKVVLESDYQITTAGSHKLDPNGHNVTTADGLYLGLYSAETGYTVYDAAARALAPNICLSYLTGTAAKVFDGVCVADIVDGGFSVAARVSGGYVTSTVRGTRGTVVAGDVVRENGVATSAKFLYYIADAANGYQLKGVLVTFTNGAEGLYAKVEQVGQIDNATGDMIAKMTSGTIATGNTANGYTVTQLQLKKGEDYLGGLTAEYDFNVANGYERWGVLTTTANFGVSDGTLTIDAGETLTAKLFRASNTDDSSDRAVVNVEGTLAISADSDSPHVWGNQAAGGIMSAHWRGLSTWNVTGTVDCPNAYFELNYRDTHTVLNINGGTVTAKGLYANNQMGSEINLTNNGVLEVAKQGNNASGFYTEKLGYGTYRNTSSTAWTDAQAIQFTDAENGTVLDGTTGAMTFSGAITGSGKAIVKGTVNFTGSLADTCTVVVSEGATITLPVTQDQIAAGESVTFENVTVPAGVSISFVGPSGALLEVVTTEAAGNAVWSGASGDYLDEMGYQPKHWYKFDNNYDSFGQSAITFNGTATKPGADSAPYVAGVKPGVISAFSATTSADMYYSNVSYGSGNWTSVASIKLLSDYVTEGEHDLIAYGTNEKGVQILAKLVDGVPAVALQAWDANNAANRTTGDYVKVPDALEAFHSYAVTYDTATHQFELFIDGVDQHVPVEKSVTINGNIQFGRVYGGGVGTNGGGVFEDWRVYQSKLSTDYLKAIADGMADQNFVALIDETKYYTLAAAIEAADAEDEIEIVANCTISDTTLTKAIALKVADGASYTISGGKFSGDSLTKTGAGALTVTYNVPYLKELNVNEGTLDLRCDNQSIRGIVTIAYGATLDLSQNAEGDRMPYSGDIPASFNIKGTLNLGTRRQSLHSNTIFNIYAGATIEGEGDNSAAYASALDMAVRNNTNHRFNFFKDGGVGDTVSLNTVVCLRNAMDIHIERGLTVNWAGAGTPAVIVKKYSGAINVYGEGTLNVTGEFWREGDVKIADPAAKIVATILTPDTIFIGDNVKSGVTGFDLASSTEADVTTYTLSLAASEITPTADGLVITVDGTTIEKDGVVLPEADGTIPAATGVYAVKKGDATIAEVAVVAQAPAAGTTLVAVPFEGLDGAAVTAASLLNTKLLAEGDQLKVYDGAKYRLWTLTAEKTWDAGKTVTAAGVVEAESAADITLARGAAAWVTTAATIMTYGRKNAPDVKPVVTSGLNLLGNTKMVATDLADVADPGDQVEIPGDTSGVRTFTKTADGWTGVKTVVTTVTVGGKPVQTKSTVETTEAPSIPAGRGYFLKR